MNWTSKSSRHFKSLFALGKEPGKKKEERRKTKQGESEKRKANARKKFPPAVTDAEAGWEKPEPSTAALAEDATHIINAVFSVPRSTCPWKHIAPQWTGLDHRS
jgi:hypothetical protein